jgi:hypothetical protein
MSTCRQAYISPGSAGKGDFMTDKRIASLGHQTKVMSAEAAAVMAFGPGGAG